MGIAMHVISGLISAVTQDQTFLKTFSADEPIGLIGIICEYIVAIVFAHEFNAASPYPKTRHDLRTNP